jgi:hypothetical protein
MNMFATSQNQPRLSSITDVAPGGSANQIAVSAILNYLTMLWKELHVYLNTINTADVTCGAGISYLSGGKYLKTCTKFVSLYIPLKNFSRRDRGDLNRISD